jgi:two-component system phosphate regulon sensor histidine kinase PhoR
VPVPVLGDAFGRAVLGRCLVLALVILLGQRLGLAWSIALGILGALVVAGDLVARLAPVRRRVDELAEEGGEEHAADSSLDALAVDVARARERLAETRRRVEHERDDVLGILEATTQGILVLGHHFRIEMLNDAARRLLDAPLDPLGRTLQEVVRVPELVAMAEELRRTGRVEKRTIELPAGEQPRIVSVSGALVRSARLRQRGVLVLDDLTDLAHLESVRTEFVANVTHEMRSPLASILGYAETLALDDALSEEGKGFLERIQRNARRLDDIIGDLIELSRLEHATAPEIGREDVRALLEEVVAGFADAARDRGLDLALEADGLPGELGVDAALVRQAVTNLLDNAVKYTPAGGSVRVTAALPLDESSRTLTVSVSDTGTGIPTSHRARIFERFYRVDTARSRSLGGTGLGLAIVKHATALHGGRVDLESSDEGSVFRVFFPLGQTR